MPNAERTIVELERLVSELPEPERERFARIYSVTTDVAEVVIPAPMMPFVEKRFGSADAVTRQTIVKVTNLVTMEAANFNALRARRPRYTGEQIPSAEIAEGSSEDPFCSPLEQTTENTFGRVRGAQSVTAANLVPFDRFHSVIIFDHQNPLEFTRESLSDALDTALTWARLAHSHDNEARYFFLFWNCLWRAGASRVHGHLQATLGRGMHYAQVESLRRAALLYRLGHGDNYFDDLIAVHRALGLLTELEGMAVFASLTPKKEKEVWIVSPRLDDALKRALYETLRLYVHRLHVQSFNMALLWRPIDSVPEDWDGFPVIFRLVDRGSLNSRVSDIASMELYGSTVVSSDPFEVADAIQEALG